MRLRIRRISIAAAIAVAVPTVVVASLSLAVGMALSGTWPFEPLAHRSREIALANGALIRIEGVEDRGWGSSGYLWTASFRDRREAGFVRIGGWIGHRDDWSVYTPGELIVCLNPDRHTLHVRGSNGQWKLFELRLPGRTENLANFIRVTPALAEADLRRFQADLTDAETSSSPATEILTFDPATLEIRTRVLTALTREAIVGLSEDGQSVRLKSLRVIER
jgi:hypothetical protein